MATPFTQIHTNPSKYTSVVYKLLVFTTESKKDETYNSKQERTVQLKWQDEFNGLLHDEHKYLMFCKYCLKYPKLAETKDNQK